MQRRQPLWSRCSPGTGGTLRKRDGGPRDQGMRPTEKGEETKKDVGISFKFNVKFTCS